MESGYPSLSFQRARVGRRLWWAAIIAILLSSVLAVLILLHLYQAFDQARQNSRLLRDLYLVLDAANRISEERAPSNILMGDSGSAIAIHRLQAVRAETDIALRQLTKGLIPADPLERTERQLDTARRQVDQVARLAVVSDADVDAAIEAMFFTYDIFQEVVVWQAMELMRSDPKMQGIVLQALALCDLRDATGRLGSHLVAPLVARIPIPTRNLERISRTRERIAMQWWQLELGGATSSVHFPLLKSNAWQHFDQEGRRLLASVIAEGRAGGAYSLNATHFTERYRATLTPLETWRRVYLQQLIADSDAEKRNKAYQFFAVLTCALVIVSLICWIIVVVRLRMLEPLLDVSKSMVALMEERPLLSRLRRRSARELDMLFDALDAVAGMLKERDDLTRQLRMQADTDPLTRLLNRRAFESFSNSMLAESSDGLEFLILLDLDHFKSINDLHGHAAGDCVLVAVADALIENVRPGELVARIGGEEFAVLMKAPDITAAMGLARRLQIALRKLALTAPDGTSIPVSASIGIAKGDHMELHQLLSKADNALYEAKRSGRDCIRVVD